MSLFTKITDKFKSKSDKTLDTHKYRRSKSEIKLNAPMNHVPEKNIGPQLMQMSGVINPIAPVSPIIYLLKSPANHVYVAVKYKNLTDNTYTCISSYDSIHPEIIRINSSWSVSLLDYNAFKQLYDINLYQLQHRNKSIEYVHAACLELDYVILSGDDAGRIITNCPVFYNIDSK